MRVTPSSNLQANNKAAFGMKIKPGKGYGYIPNNIINIIAESKEEISKMEPVDKDLLAMVTSGGMDHFDLELQAGLPENEIIHRTVSSKMRTEDSDEIKKALIGVAQEISEEYGKLKKKLEVFS